MVAVTVTGTRLSKATSSMVTVTVTVAGTRLSKATSSMAQEVNKEGVDEKRRMWGWAISFWLDLP